MAKASFIPCEISVTLPGQITKVSKYVRVVSAVRSVWDGELDTLLLWLDDIWASSNEGEGEGLSRIRSYQNNQKLLSQQNHLKIVAHEEKHELTSKKCPHKDREQ